MHVIYIFTFLLIKHVSSFIKDSRVIYGKNFRQRHNIETRSFKDTVITHKARLSISIGDEDFGQIVVGLFGEVAPKTTENFVELCQDTSDGYAGTIFHRVIKGFMMQGGDVTHKDGTGGRSIYGPEFDDENLNIKHMGAGTLSMANSGPDSNNSQFFITFVNTEWLNGKHQVFGKVLSGMNIVKEVESVQTNKDDRPLENVTITDCEAKKVEEFTLQDYMNADA
ncbi:peptidyl-prolyl cis-trans isomerase B [Hydra vulgaris]|uniref:Peptidyl-prolyl cis-trans isomerase n=1 Tax=Hydra vulgaris TaxID=6087 RepID=A0ABM4CP48_HYDVU